MIGRFSSTGKSSEPDPEIAELRREIDRLREFVEARARAQEKLVRAMLADSTPRAAEALEPRIRLATREAMAFAEQGLQQHEAALRAMGRRIAELSLAPPPHEPALAAPAAAASYFLGLASPDTRDCLPLELSGASEEAYLAGLAHLPILPGGAVKLVATHVIEYASADALARTILPHWRSRLAPGGELIVVTRDGPAWAADLARSASDFDAFRRKLGADGAGRAPRSLFDEQGLRRLLEACGFAPAARIAGADPLELRIGAQAAP